MAEKAEKKPEAAAAKKEEAKREPAKRNPRAVVAVKAWPDY